MDVWGDIGTEHGRQGVLDAPGRALRPFRLLPYLLVLSLAGCALPAKERPWRVGEPGNSPWTDDSKIVT
jgi:hypothetical protein